MENFKLVLPGHMNHYGYLFGGYLLQWVDEVAWIAASKDYPGCNFVTIGMDRVEFRKSIHQGSILRFHSQRQKAGRTSVRYDVNVYCDDLETGKEDKVFSTGITFVCLNHQGEKQPLSE
jgi:acyl-CoA hydrolase